MVPHAFNNAYDIFHFHCAQKHQRGKDHLRVCREAQPFEIQPVPDVAGRAFDIGGIGGDHLPVDGPREPLQKLLRIPRRNQFVERGSLLHHFIYGFSELNDFLRLRKF